MRAYLGAISPEQNLHQVLGNRPSEQLDEWLAGEETVKPWRIHALAVDP